MTQSNLDRYVWCDLETFGLDPRRDPIIEIGFVITDIELEVIDDFQCVVWDSPWYDNLLMQLSDHANDGHAGSKIVLEMHQKSGLWFEAQEEGRTLRDAEIYAASFLEGHGVSKGDPLCGSSVHFDREMLKSWTPAAAELFSYRDVDVSTLKELCMRENPDVYTQLASATQQMKMHRVLDDIRDTISEFAFYKDRFLKINHPK
jgi:oligoribonuclease